MPPAGRFFARWIAFLGYALALLLLSTRNIPGILMAFPLWVLLVSVYILVGDRRGPFPVSAPALEKYDHN